MLKKRCDSIFDIEINSLKNLKKIWENVNIEKIIDIINNSNKLIITGVGKTGFVGQKISAMLNSVGIKSVYLHSSEAIHGDLGIVEKNDIILGISYSGKTKETFNILNILKDRGHVVLAMVGNTKSDIAEISDYVLPITVDREADSFNKIPTSSTTAAMLIGDVLCCLLIDKQEKKIEDFAYNHPGGGLGKQLTRLEKILPKEFPSVDISDSLKKILDQIILHKKGIAAVSDKGKFVGIVTDGDVRRKLYEIKDIDVNKIIAKDIINKSPISLYQDISVEEAIQKMRSKKILAAPVLNNSQEVVSILSLYDLLR